MAGPAMKAPGVGVALLVHKGSQVLLVHRINAHGAGTWSPPGGHLEFGETFEECAVRETLEETGVQVSNLRYLALTNDFFESEGRHYVTIWMQADYFSGELHGQQDELSELDWFDEDALPSPQFLPLRNLLSGKNRYPWHDVPSAGCF